MEMRIFNKAGEEKNIAIEVKARPNSLDIKADYRGAIFVSSFRKGIDFQTALSKVKKNAIKFYFNED